MKRGCYKKDPNSIRQRVEDLLLEHGPMSMSSILEELSPGPTKGGVSKTICDLRDAGVVYIKAWEMTEFGQRRYPRPLWDHAQHSKRQPPVNKMRPLPVENAARLKKRRVERGAGAVLQVRYLYKLVKDSAT